jgi:hypothetical protein
VNVKGSFSGTSSIYGAPVMSGSFSQGTGSSGSFYGGSGGGNPTPLNQSTFQKSNKVRLIEVPQSFQQIQLLQENQQKSLLQNDSDFKFYFSKLDVIKEIDAIRENVKKENSEIASKKVFVFF